MIRLAKTGLFSLSSVLCLLCYRPADALIPPDAMMIDGGPFGQLQLSGGATGSFYAQTGTSNTSEVGNKTSGAVLNEMVIDLAKTSGVIQYELQTSVYGGTIALGTQPEQASTNSLRSSPISLANITISPSGSPFRLSAGVLNSLEGYEASISWYNDNLFTSDLWYVENAQNVGVLASYTHGPLSVEASFSDGFDTRVFNFLQTLVSYTINDNNSANFYASANLGQTGMNVRTYNGLTLGEDGPNYANSTMFGGYYTWTHGNLSLTPEVQYVYAKPNQSVGVTDFTSNLGAVVFSHYAFGNSPYSIGGMAEYFSSNGSGYWFIAPHAQGYGLELTPTWQHGHIFARFSAGFLHLTNGAAFGAGGTGRNVVQSAVQAGLLF